MAASSAWCLGDPICKLDVEALTPTLHLIQKDRPPSPKLMAMARNESLSSERLQ